MNFSTHYLSPLGGMTMASDGEFLTGLWFDGQKYFPNAPGKELKAAELPIFALTIKWLDLYFAGEVPTFTPPLHAEGTPFRQAVWDILRSIPYGQTTTYGEIADRIARQENLPHMSAQAVGGAVGHNPISILIPCHRVIGADGSLTGYAGGIHRKRALLHLEGFLMSPSERPLVSRSQV